MKAVASNPGEPVQPERKAEEKRENREQGEKKSRGELDFSCLKTLGELDIEDTVPVVFKKRGPAEKEKSLDYSNDNFVSLTSLHNPKYQFNRLGKKVDTANSSYQLNCSKSYCQQKEACVPPKRPPLQFLAMKPHVSSLNQNARPSSVRNTDCSIDFSRHYLKSPAAPVKEKNSSTRLEALLQKSKEQSRQFQWKNTVELSGMV